MLQDMKAWMSFLGAWDIMEKLLEFVLPPPPGEPWKIGETSIKIIFGRRCLTCCVTSSGYPPSGYPAVLELEHSNLPKNTRDSSSGDSFSCRCENFAYRNETPLCVNLSFFWPPRLHIYQISLPTKQWNNQKFSFFFPGPEIFHHLAVFVL